MKLIQSVSNNSQEIVGSKKTIEFKIGDVGRIVEILRSKIYSDPIGTLVQEYLCNARDAVREVGGDKIVVSIPTEENPILRIRDYGPGISKDRMMNTFVQYGNTTKADSNKQTGGFGLGSKLGWAYSDTFRIITYVDGVEYFYIASVNKNKNGTLDLMSEKKTNRENGTVIEIDVKSDDIHDFRSAVYRTTQFWSVKPEIENDPYIPSAWASPQVVKLSKVISMYTDLDRFKESKIILAIDGIPYPLSRDFIRNNRELEDLADLLNRKAAVVLHIGNGLIEIAASRESISENERTLKVIRSKVSEAKTLIEKWVKDTLKSKSLSQLVTNFKTVQSYASEDKVEVTLDGEKFKLQASHDYHNNLTSIHLSSDLMEKLQIVKFKDGKRQKERHYSSKSINLSQPILILDETLNVAKANAKFKQVATGGTLLGKGEQTLKYLKALGEELGAKVSSEIVLLKVVREKEVVPEGTIKAQMFGSNDYYSRKTLSPISIDLAVNTQTFVYMTKDQAPKITIFSALTKVLSEDKVSLVILSQSSVKLIEGNKNFIAFDDFMKDPLQVLSKHNYEGLLRSARNKALNYCAGELEFLVHDPKLLKQVKDKKLKSSLSVIAKNQTKKLYREYSFDAEDFLFAHLLETYPELKKLQALAADLPKYVKAKYPLLQCLSGYSEVKDAVKNQEVVYYLNGKN